MIYRFQRLTKPAGLDAAQGGSLPKAVELIYFKHALVCNLSIVLNLGHSSRVVEGAYCILHRVLDKFLGLCLSVLRFQYLELRILTLRTALKTAKQIVLNTNSCIQTGLLRSC